MNNEEIAALKAAHKVGEVWWRHDHAENPRKVARIGAPPKPDEGDEEEPSECAYLADGTHVALWNGDLAQFTITSQISAAMPAQADAKPHRASPGMR